MRQPNAGRIVKFVALLVRLRVPTSVDDLMERSGYSRANVHRLIAICRDHLPLVVEERVRGQRMHVHCNRSRL